MLEPKTRVKASRELMSRVEQESLAIDLSVESSQIEEMAGRKGNVLIEEIETE